MKPTLSELLAKFGFNTEEVVANAPQPHPIAKKHIEATLLIEAVYDYQKADKISLGKARELTAAIIHRELPASAKCDHVWVSSVAYKGARVCSKCNAIQ